MADYNDGNWHGWNGGECPVHPKTVVDALFGDGGKQPQIKGEHLDWSAADKLPRSHVAAFRVVKEYRQPREFWINPSAGLLTKKPTETGSWIKVREVQEDEAAQ